MITTNVIHRTFRIEYRDRIGSCFTIDMDNSKYLVTAKHIVKEITNSDIVRINHEGKWKRLQVELIGHGKGNIDLSVLAGNFSFSVDYEFPASMADLCYGQDVYFLGFPNVVDVDKLVPSIQKLNRNFPLPITRKAVVCWMNEEYILLDGHGNKGFSGGPVIFKSNNKNLFSVAGVISCFHPEIKPVYETELQAKMPEGQKPIGYYRDNPGIITVYSIKYALDLIDQYLIKT